MLITYQREKLINAILYFVKNTNYCDEIKLFNLLFHLDFKHFRETGRCVTELVYFSERQGPVPKILYEEFQNPKGDLAEAVSIKNEIFPQKEPYMGKFSQREKRIMLELVEEYKDLTAAKMFERVKPENIGKEISYEVALEGLDEATKAMILEAAEENEVLNKIFGNGVDNEGRRHIQHS